ncbi:hypothetical protein Barb7_02992 [Bacteroidales bacterium Barb7]|nr:hypothetical protein Barb7_02992 [Bacteroidales bacterium Barb7]
MCGISVRQGFNQIAASHHILIRNVQHITSDAEVKQGIKEEVLVAEVGADTPCCIRHGITHFLAFGVVHRVQTVTVHHLVPVGIRYRHIRIDVAHRLPYQRFYFHRTVVGIMRQFVQSVHQLDNLVLVESKIGTDIPAEILCLDRRTIQGKFQAVVLQFSHIQQNGSPPGGLRHSSLQYLILHRVGIVRQFKAQTVVKELAFHTKFPLELLFRTDTFIAQRTGHGVVNITADRTLIVRQVGSIYLRCVTYHTVRSAYLPVVIPRRTFVFQRFGKNIAGICRRIEERIVPFGKRGCLFLPNSSFQIG